MKLLVAFILLFSALAFAAPPQSVSVYSSATYTVGLVYTQEIPQQTQRAYLLIQNNGAANVCVGFGIYSSAADCVIVPPGGNYEPYRVPIDAIFMVSSMVGQSVYVVEGQ